ncbi:unnamed protein product, partial [Mesorhabditis belari]|uniref:G-protein coupled receptors family 1 profile domain-containing protein n=1 Tax=Mesorhabditis belari TaxID=2138241 RepID=A0AAF3J9Z1_9BILA
MEEPPPTQSFSFAELFLESDHSVRNPNGTCSTYFPPPLIAFRFGLVTVFGSIVALIGMVENLLLLYLFASRKHHRTSYNLYMMLLAVFDTFVSGAYVPLMSVNVAGDFFEDPWLVKIWYSYMRPIYTISHVGLTASTFLIVAATFERYCITMNSRALKWAQRNRLFIASFAVIMGIFSKGTIGYELLYITAEDCKGTMMEISLTNRKFVYETQYHEWMRLWYRNLVTIVAPFLILLILNFLIIRALRRQPQMTVCSQLAGPAAADISKRKMARRNATKSLLLVGICYLFANVFHLVALVWEQNDSEDARNQHEVWSKVYAILIDVASLLSVVACAFRLPILISCQQQLREEVKTILRNVFCCKVDKKPQDDNEKLVTSGQSSHTTHENGMETSNKEKKEIRVCLPVDGNDNALIPSTKSLSNGKHYSIDGLQIYFHNGNETLL